MRVWSKRFGRSWAVAMEDAFDLASEVGSVAEDVAGPVAVEVARRIHGPNVRFCTVGVWCGWRPIKPGKENVKLSCLLCKIDCQAKSPLESALDTDEWLGLVPWPLRIHSQSKLIRKHKGKVCLCCCTVFRLYSRLGDIVAAKRASAHMHARTHPLTHIRTHRENARKRHEEGGRTQQKNGVDG